MAKKALALILTVLLALAFTCPVFAETTIEHPKVIVYGNVTKTVYPGRSIFEYEDDQGLSSVLPFERQDENITINFSNIVFADAFLNRSVANYDTSGSSPELTLTKEMLSNGDIEYIYLKAINNTALTTSTAYTAYFTCDIEDRSITDSDHIVFTAKVNNIGDNLDFWEIWCEFTILDTGANTRKLKFQLFGSTGTDMAAWSPSTNSAYIMKYGIDNTYFTFQYNIKDFIENLDASWIPSKITELKYVLVFKTGTSLDATSGVEASIVHTFIANSKVYIDDTSENGLILNGTSGSFPYSAGETVNIYGANATKIVGVTIPWQWEITPEIETDAENLQMQYTWEFTFPKSPEGIGDSLTFSNTNITLYGYKNGDAWDRLYLNGVDKLSNIASKQVDETTGYWTYGLASSLTEGNMYQIIARITYTADEFDSLTEAPVFWTNPVAWIQYKFWELVIAIASFLGLGTAWAVRQKRKLRTPKR